MPQFLRAFEVGPYVYSLAGLVHPINIRDQMNRAVWLVERAYDEGFFGPYSAEADYKPISSLAAALSTENWTRFRRAESDGLPRPREFRRLLVIGAGAPGVAAATRAARLGVETILVDASKNALGLQLNCDRFIDPLHHDWTATDWCIGRRSVRRRLWAGTRPLDWRAGEASMIAVAWGLRFRKFCASLQGRRFLQVLENITIDPATVHTVKAYEAGRGTQSGVAVPNFDGSRGEQRFGMVLWCTGLKSAGCETPTASGGQSIPYRGFGYWEADPFLDRRWGLSDRWTAPTAVVVGGSAAALEDALRLTTHEHSAVNVYRRLFPHGLADRHRRRLAAAEDRAARALAWATPGSSAEHEALAKLGASYDAVVAAVIESDWARLDPAVKKLLEACPGRVDLVHTCTHFGRVSGMLQFVVRLVAAASQALPNGLRIMPQQGLASVQCLNHLPSPSAEAIDRPWQCHDFQHRVILRPWPRCCETPAWVHTRPVGDATELTVNFVVPRRYEPNPAILRKAPMMLTRQVMPGRLPTEPRLVDEP